MGLLEDIRKKPKPVRDQYAFFSALAITAVIAGVWALSIPARFSETAISADGIEEQTGAFSKYFGELKDGAANVIDSIKGESELIEAEENTRLKEGQLDIEDLMQKIPTVIEDNQNDKTPLRHVLIGTSSSEKSTEDEN